MLPGTNVHAEAVVEHAGLQRVARPRAVLDTCGLACRSPAGGTLGVQHLLHLRRELNHRGAAEQALAWGHPGPDACHDRPRRVIANVLIEVAAHTILARLRGHEDLNVHVVLPLEHGYLHIAGQDHVYHALLVALRNHVRNLARIVVCQGETVTRIAAGETWDHWPAIHGQHSALLGANLNLVAVQEWPAHNNPVRRGQPLRVLRALEAALDDDGGTFHNVEIALR